MENGFKLANALKRYRLQNQQLVIQALQLVYKAAISDDYQSLCSNLALMVARLSRTR